MRNLFSVRLSAPAYRLALVLMFLLASCSVDDKPQAIELGKDECAGCKMAITDGQFGCEFITDKGRCLKFDDLSCLFHYIGKNEITDSQILKIYVSDYQHPGTLIDIKTAGLVLGDDIKSPMNGGVAAFGDRRAAEKFAVEHQAILLDSWTRLKQQHHE
ncbi:nitrous oxide reductase accessory protein NosL [Prevotella sp. kh1p2]|uniref:nitrous oxide reductase accessory protein NosL n=1 Tax=Prevotella sp. kh1p2 TaxID=1761883 RepID=UPI0008D8CAC9|nr:nitrous oxide reductase accessory protein NosL [Prevotella sp. kh1p2]SET16470.1 copper chaperone NosL [Prevotella sp. kh1p2]SNU12578.1 copper chaperone NosL [Prevotellaceae bacterium KH2P17]